MCKPIMVGPSIGEAATEARRTTSSRRSSDNDHDQFKIQNNTDDHKPKNPIMTMINSKLNLDFTDPTIIHCN